MANLETLLGASALYNSTPLTSAATGNFLYYNTYNEITGDITVAQQQLAAVSAPAVKAKADEFAWLRGRVEDLCWHDA